MLRRKWAIFVGALLGFGCCMVLPCTDKARDGAGWVRSSVSLRGVGLALRNYHDVHGKLPPAVVRGKDGSPLYSWRVLVLPYLEEKATFEAFNLAEPWDSPHNLPLLEKMPYSFAPVMGGNPGGDRDQTHYQVFVGPGTAFERDGLTWKDSPDGLENTFLVVEAAVPVPWTKPVDLDYDPAGPLPSLGGVYGKPIDFLCYQIGSRSGFNAVFADGSARFVSAKNDPQVIRCLITRNGGEKVDPSSLK